MLKQKRLSILALLVITALLWAACAPAAPSGNTAAPAGDAPVADAGAREIVWMVRTGPVENKWEETVVAPAWEKEHPEIKLNILNIVQDDIAVKREAMTSTR